MDDSLPVKTKIAQQGDQIFVVCGNDDLLFKPLSMTKTGFSGDTFGFGADAFATGYGVSIVGAPNIPPNWGPTSWWVMGSGGMVSTLDDMVRFDDGVAGGTAAADSKLQPPRDVQRERLGSRFLLFRIRQWQG